jgi:protein-S-isoprenylcysteine O-methyltransferase Ste14
VLALAVAPGNPLRQWGFLVACAAWALFALYWDSAAKRAAPAKSSESTPSRLLHVLPVNIALLMVFLPFPWLKRYAVPSTGLTVAGLVLLAMGMGLAVWARRHLGRNWSGRISIMVDHRLIRSGPYRWLRHPIYTGLLAMYSGAALVTGTWLALAGVAIVVLAYARKIRLEEANLELAFGGEYREYRRTTWALLPGLY